MIIAVDFDGTVVEQDHAYDDLHTPFRLVTGVDIALQAIKAAGHTLILVSARANRALRIDWRLNPLWREGAVRFNEGWWLKNRELNQKRYEQMVRFVGLKLPGVFDAIDDGLQGKISADLYIDDRAVRFGIGHEGKTWVDLARMYGRVH